MLIASVFEPQQDIPMRYTCDGENISPSLKFAQIPSSAKSLALVMDDPDAPHGTFDHWVVWNLPPDLQGIPEGGQGLDRLAPQLRRGTNGYRVQEYKGPCPPAGKPHRYYFKLYALDAWVSLPEGSSKEELQAAMEGHIIEQAELVGLYQRPRR